MSERAIQPEASHDQEAPEQSASPAEETQAGKGSGMNTAAPPEEKIIWTPAFFLTFALTLVVGLSAESLFTLGWQNGILPAQWWFILAHVLLNGLAWLVLGIVTRSRWIRVGCIFGGIWTLFMGLNIFTNVQGLDPNAPLQSYINVAICMALLGAYLGLSIEGTLLTRWDIWLFFGIPILSACGVVLTYILTPQASILTSENALAACALVACCLFWWLRPSCWRKGPGPTFIFGVIPVIALVAAVSNTSMHDFFLLHVTNIHTNPRPETNNFFFAQVILLCLLLGCIRMIKSEKTN